jgi:phage gpG-like protein
MEMRLDDRDLQRALDELARRAERGWFREVAPLARADQKEHAQRQEGPDEKWAPRDPDTTARRPRKRRRVLGRLPGAVKVSVHPDAVEIESRVAWSDAHQKGGIVGNGARLPERPFLWWSEEFLADAGEAAIIYTTRNWGRGG